MRFLAAVMAAATFATAHAQTADSKRLDDLTKTVEDLKATDAGLQETVVKNQQAVQEAMDSPSSIHYKGVTFTPVAFFAFENVWRERALNSDINTPFNSIPLPGGNQGHVSELNFSGRQSRIGGLFEGNAGAFKLSGYFEADFLGSGTTSNGNQSNSYVLRQRQIWGQAAMKNGFTVTGGQMWSLVTEDARGTDARTEKLPTEVDAQYTVGFSWARQPGIRFQQRFGDVTKSAVTVALSLENAQITNLAAAGAAPTNYFFSGTGTNGGLYNNTTTYTNNLAPDVIVKAAYDLPKAHFELGGLARFLRDFYYPFSTAANGSAGVVAAGTPYTSNTKAAGGVFASARVTTSKYVDLGASMMVGEGLGRYGSAQLADATVHPDGTLEPIRGGHGLLSIETHPAKKLDIVAYYGGEYAQRTVYTTSAGALEGYGVQNQNDTGCYAVPTSQGSTAVTATTITNCGSPTRYIQEALLGFVYRFVNSPKYGKFQYTVNYQLVQRNLWSGVAAAGEPSGPRAQDSMILTGLRYYIP